MKTNDANEQPQKRSEMRDRLAESAFELFSENQITAVTLDMIAEKASVTKGSLYCHYKSKKELILEACECYYRRWERQVLGYANLDSDPMSRLRKALIASTELCLFDERNRFFTAQVFVLAIKEPEVKASWAVFYQKAHDFYVGILKEISDLGLANISSPKENADKILAIMEGIKQQSFFDPEATRPSKMGVIVDLLIRTALESRQ